eukprot:GHVR01104658.1.p1 GENE.GHVR01104658.1~~GHVR01104658.1.p1  ORF type:complete len:137 (+),score=1.09 GHVR01104658.1:2-412(+)
MHRGRYMTSLESFSFETGESLFGGLERSKGSRKRQRVCYFTLVSFTFLLPLRLNTDVVTGEVLTNSRNYPEVELSVTTIRDLRRLGYTVTPSTTIEYKLGILRSLHERILHPCDTSLAEHGLKVPTRYLTAGFIWM